MNTPDWIAKWAEHTPGKVAVTSYDTGEQYTYEALSAYADRLTHKFLALGLREGDRVVVLAEHGPEYIVIFSACQRMGAILVPLNYRLSAYELSELISDCSPALLIYSNAHRHKLSALADAERRMLLSLHDIRNYYTAQIPVTSPEYTIKEDHPLFIFYTSGTTGAPKGVIYTNAMLFWNSLNTAMQLEITFSDATLNVLPPYHTSGWNVFVTPLLHQGGHIGMLGKFDPEKTLQLLEHHDISLFMALPTMLMMMRNTPVFDTVNLETLRYIVSGGEAISSELVLQWKKQKNIAIRSGYGLTEAGPGITSLHHDMVLEKPGSIGKPNFYVDLKIVDPQDEIITGNTVGELCIKGYVVTPGYWNDSVATRDKIKDGWLHTGDLACRDDDGYLYLKGRRDDMYISGGENIYPQEIETVIRQLEGVKEAVILSMEDAQWGACGIAFVTAEDDTVSVSAIRDFLKAHVAGYKHPKYIFILEEIPQTSLGKVSRKKLYDYVNLLKSGS